MAKAITVRLDETDHIALHRQAERLQLRPGTLARILVHAGLNEDASDSGASEARAALARLVQRSQNRPNLDAVGLVSEARSDLGSVQ